MLSVTIFCSMLVMAENIETAPLISVSLNDNQLDFDVPPMTENNRVFVPMRKIFETLGATVDWNGDTQSATAVKDDNLIIIQIDNPIMQKNNETIELDAPPRVVDGRTLVPIRAIAEGLGADVQWIEQTQSVVIQLGEHKRAEPATEKYSVQILLEPSTINYLGWSQDGITFFEQNGKRGYINNITGEIVPAEDNLFISEELRCFKQDGYYGAVNQSGKIVIPFEYNQLKAFDEGIALASKTISGVEKWGKIDTTGKIVVPFEYTSGEWVDSEMNLIQQENQYGLNDLKGNVIIHLGNNRIIKNKYSEGFTIFYPGETLNEQRQYCGITKGGKIVFSAIYDAIDSYGHEGMAQVRKGDKCGFINLSGELVIPLIYDDAEAFSEGLAFVKKDGKWGFINKLGEAVIDFEYDGDTASYITWDSRFHNGFSKVCKNGKLGIINQNGNVIIPIEYDEIKQDYDFMFLSQCGIIPVKKNALWGIADVNGNLLVACQLAWIDNFYDGYAFFAEGNTSGSHLDTSFSPNADTYGILNIKGEIMATGLSLNPMYSYHQAGVDGGSFSGGANVNRPTGFYEGLAAAHDENGKWGYINPVGEIVIEPQFDTITQDGTRVGAMAGAGAFKGGYAKVYTNGAYNIIDKQGNLMLDNSWDSICQDWSKLSLNGYVPMGDECFICQNADGNLRIMSKNCELVLLGENGNIFDENGELLLSYDPKSIVQIGEGIFSYEHEGKKGVFSVKV